MPNKVSVCIIKIEIDVKLSEDFEAGAVSSEHPTNPRLIKERERDRGLRIPSEIQIETYTNLLYSTDIETMSNSNALQQDKSDLSTVAMSSKELTPLDESQCASELPKEIGFFSGNPSVEVTNGIIHIYKKNERKEIKDAPSNQLCLLAVPASLNCHDLLTFVAPCHAEIQHIRIVRDGSPNQFMVLLEFRSNESALEFYRTYNGAAYNSLEPDSVCHAVWVSSVERGENGITPLGHTELPTCPVCLERMDESVDGVLTILCNHAFHANCLVKWGDSTCPVCRHIQTPDLMDKSVCMECEGVDSLWICLICGHVGCGRYQGGHAAAHYRATNHTFALQLGTSSVWDYAGDNFVHRLFQNKTDGKLVATQAPPNDDDDEKVDSMQLEFTYILTSQLDSQRKFYEDQMSYYDKEWKEFRHKFKEAKEEMTSLHKKIETHVKERTTLERKLFQNTNKLKEIQKQLNEEKQISKALQNNQTSWQTKYSDLETEFNDFRESRNLEISSLKEQLRDIMFYMDAQNKIAESEFKDEIVDGAVVIPQKTTKPNGKHNRQRKKKN